jgi:hypothetical protein
MMPTTFAIYAHASHLIFPKARQWNNWNASQIGVTVSLLSISTHLFPFSSMVPLSSTDPKARSHPSPTAANLQILDLCIQ